MCHNRPDLFHVLKFGLFDFFRTECSAQFAFAPQTRCFGLHAIFFSILACPATPSYLICPRTALLLPLVRVDLTCFSPPRRFSVATHLLAFSDVRWLPVCPSWGPCLPGISSRSLKCVGCLGLLSYSNPANRATSAPGRMRIFFARSSIRFHTAQAALQKRPSPRLSIFLPGLSK